MGGYVVCVFSFVVSGLRFAEFVGGADHRGVGHEAMVRSRNVLKYFIHIHFFMHSV
jgi:hypothetical protein